MKIAFALLSLASLALAGVSNNAGAGKDVFDKRSCSGNNCNRAITGTRNGLPATALRSADCSSFLLTVVTPSPIVETTWVEENTKTLATATLALHGAVTVKPSVKPTYATACSSSADYASACSCWGITGRVSTAPVPTVTVTSTYAACEL